jgi:hypothetical protein
MTCRKAHSAAFNPFLVFNSQQVTITGDLSAWESSPAYHRYFCPQCGSRIFGGDPQAKEVELSLGSFDDPGLFSPNYEMWTIRREPWLSPLDTPQHERDATEDQKALVRLQSEQPPQDADNSTAVIMREWRAEIRRDTRDEYLDYVRSTGLTGYRATPGNLGAGVAIRDIDDHRSEIVTLSLWTSLDAIRAFAGDPVDQARYFPEDDRYLLTRPERVTHYDLTGLNPCTER